MTARRSKKAGLPPGTLVYIGDNHRTQTLINVCRYGEFGLEEKQVQRIEDALVAPQDGETLWIDIDGIHDTSVIEKVGKFFNLHPLVLEDILNTTKRPKFEEFDNYLLTLLKVIHPLSNGKKFLTEQVSVILGKNFVLSFQEIDRHDAFGQVRERLKGGKGRIRKMGADYLMYALLDSIVDSYFGVLETLGETLQDLEHKAITSADTSTLREIQRVKHQALLLRRAVWPVREIMSAIVREESSLVTKPTLLFLRDVYDHTIEVIDVLEADRDMAAGLMEIYLSGLSNRMNSVMMVLTVITTIFMPLTFIVGLYGMNFRHMPELEWQYGYPMVIGVMIVIAVAMLSFFRKKGWI